MSSTTPAPAKEARPSGSPVPPEEQFWKHYSPHGEFPLSVAGSFALHALLIGGLVLFALYLSSLLFRSSRSLPVEAVRLDLGGGGGKRDGSGSGKGVGTAGAVEDPGPDKEHNPTGPTEKTPERVALTEARRRTSRRRSTLKTFATSRKLPRRVPARSRP